jgi:serine/threonine protein kinase/predicted Zn-dependent protease
MAKLPGQTAELDWSEEAPPKAAPAFRALSPAESGDDLDSWGASCSDGARLRLFHDLNRADPKTARRLADGVAALPEVGGEFLGFRLLSELGRGAFGRVYLARQDDLADRPVALKVSADAFAESQKLARLQHTHIVPVYSVHRSGLLQAVCMPYLGSITLADVLQDLERLPTLPASGKGLVSTLHERRAKAPSTVKERPPAAPSAKVVAKPQAAPASDQDVDAALPLRQLEKGTYVEAVLWIAARLADGLAHAHERGVYHRDLKPANVLLTDEGQPMLLDFNLAEDLNAAAGGARAQIGGTLPYMAPEHLAAFQGLPRVVDGRSDLYSLGVILYELLTNRHPFPRRSGAADAAIPLMIQDRQGPPPSLRRHNPAASPAVDAIVRRCLEAHPDKRYPSARELQEDLERQLRHEPLRHTREPSLRERVGKWLRRNPRTVTAGRVGAAAGVLVVLLVAALFVRGEHLARLEAAGERNGFRDDLHEARLLLASRIRDVDEQDEGGAAARRALARFGVLDDPHWREKSVVRRLPAEDQDALPAEVGELLLLLGGPGNRDAQPKADVLREALRLNQMAESCYPADRTPRSLWQQRAKLEDLLGRVDEAQQLRQRAAKTPLYNAWDRYLLARESAAEGRFQEALEMLRDVVREEPGNFAALFLMGNCFLDASTGRVSTEADAIAHYSACIALRPKFHGGYRNRALAYLRRRQYAEAEADFTQALELRPGEAACYAGRARAREGQGHYRDALADLDQALELGGANTTLYFIRSRIRGILGDKDGARADREEAMRTEPKDEEGWLSRGAERLGSGDTDGAMTDFARAVKVNPASPAGRYNQARVLIDQLKRPKDALPLFDEMLDLHPDLTMAWGGRAVLRARLGMRDEARADAAKVLELDPAGADTLFAVAGVYAQTARDDADRDEAFRLLRRSLRQGFGWDLLERDDDLKPLRDDPRFGKLAEAVRALREDGPVQRRPLKIAPEPRNP